MRESGQAAVELVALLPLLVLGTFVLAQVVIAGHAAWAAGAAARSAARAHAVGLDTRAAARSALPAHLDRRVGVRAGADGAVEVRLRVPVLVAALDLGTITARSHFEPQRG